MTGGSVDWQVWLVKERVLTVGEELGKTKSFVVANVRRNFGMKVEAKQITDEEL